MKPLHVLTISVLSLLALAACEQKTQSSVGELPANASTTVSAASTPVNSASASMSNDIVQTLASANGKVNIQIQGQFEDKLSQANDLISDIPTEQLLLLQNDVNADVLVYAADLGAAKTDATAYLTKLSDAIKADANLKNVTVNTPESNKLAYQFSEISGENTIYQACQAVHQQNIYSVCAISTTENSEKLASLIKNVAIN